MTDTRMTINDQVGLHIPYFVVSSHERDVDNAYFFTDHATYCFDRLTESDVNKLVRLPVNTTKRRLASKGDHIRIVLITTIYRHQYRRMYSM